MSKNYNYENETVKRQYFEYLEHAKGRANTTIRKITESLYLLDSYLNFESYKTINKDTIVSYKAHLKSYKSPNTGKELAESTYVHAINQLKGFLEWLKDQRGYKKLDYTTISYLALTREDKAGLKKTKIEFVPKLEDVKKLFYSTPELTDKDKRDKAIIACLFLTGARIEALASLKINSFDIPNETIIQSGADGVKTKFSKEIITKLFPIDDNMKAYLLRWVEHLKNAKGFTGKDALFPKMEFEKCDDGLFKKNKLSKDYLKSPTSIKTMIKERCKLAGIDFINPHLFRKIITQHYFEKPITPEQVKAISQNLGHENIATTFFSYGNLEPQRQIEVIEKLSA
jgi:integrase